jgi:hypothetical protein
MKALTFFGREITLTITKKNKSQIIKKNSVSKKSDYIDTFYTLKNFTQS